MQEAREKVFFECLGADEAIAAGQCEEADLLIVDPPRRGLTEGVKSFLLAKHPETALGELKRLIYISCGYDALERDAGELTESGYWRVKAAEGFALFPGTDHIEIVAVFDRTSKQPPSSG